MAHLYHCKQVYLTAANDLIMSWISCHVWYNYSIINDVIKLNLQHK
jgi:hypothetical protein